MTRRDAIGIARAEPRPALRCAAARRAACAQDRADIDRTQIIGNRELPKVLYIVPWKKPLPGDLAGRPVASVLDEALAPMDRDVFRRQVQLRRAAPDAPPPRSRAGRTLNPRTPFRSPATRRHRSHAMNAFDTAVKFFQDCGLFIYPSMLIMARRPGHRDRTLHLPATARAARTASSGRRCCRCCRAASSRKCTA